MLFQILSFVLQLFLLAIFISCVGSMFFESSWLCCKNFRSLPELSLLKETSVRGLTVSTPKANSISDTSICSSHSGELIVVHQAKFDAFFFNNIIMLERWQELWKFLLDKVDRDQEMFFISVSVLKDSYRYWTKNWTCDFFYIPVILYFFPQFPLINEAERKIYHTPFPSFFFF